MKLIGSMIATPSIFISPENVSNGSVVLAAVNVLDDGATDAGAAAPRPMNVKVDLARPLAAAVRLQEATSQPVYR